MPTQDISRYLNQPAKHYTTVQMQQGRVILDSDWNERAMAEAEDLRATLLDITCSHGTPNDGFLVHTVNLTAEIDTPLVMGHDTYDFAINAGSYYIGGLRVSLEDDTTYLGQADWTQINNDTANVPTQPVAAGGDRYDLVYLEVWEQPVCATEDSELLEVALGGRDTSVRVKRMQRILVKPGLSGTPPDCESAFTQLIGDLESGASFDIATGELVSTATLTVSPSTQGTAEDPCAKPVSVPGGYVGAQNQAIRVELRGNDKLIWGYDNASLLYRVKVVDGAPNTLEFLTEPADLPSMPRAGQIIELLQWGAELSNGERVAERQGELRRVETTYDPTTKRLVLEVDVNPDWITWLTDNTPGGETPFLFLRVWDQGDTLIAALGDPELSYFGVGPTDLGSTGLAVEIPDGTGRPGDYWIIGARPSTPEQVTPWELLSAAPPHGPREFYAPLSIIFFDDDGVNVTASVTDCRIKMRPLCEGGCCKVSVGDNKQSFGQVSSLQDAIDLLGSTGGKICVLPGEHVGTALVDGLEGANDIVIEGCGPRSRLVSVAPSVPTTATDDFSRFYTPVLHIRDAARVQLRDLRIEAHSAVGVLVEETDGNTCEEILINGVQVFATGRVDVPSSVLELAAPCITVQAASRVDIVDCEVGVDNVASLSSAIVLAGEQLRLHHTGVYASEYDGVELRAVGGVQIRSGSRDVEIIGCTIDGGWGNGISLGHAELFPRYPKDTGPALSLHYVLSQPAGGEFHQNPNLKWDCLEFDIHGITLASNDEVWLPTGPVEQIRIYDNVIRKMGLSGISTTNFFSSAFDWETNVPGPVFLVAIDIDIARNLIEENVRFTRIPESFSLNFDVCLGGICLAASICATIRENQILRNGEGLSRVPVCGIGLVAAQAATIEDNRIIGNGGYLEPTAAPALRGLRGGIAVWEVTSLRGYTFKTDVSTGPIMPAPQTDLANRSAESALVVRGNEVSQPSGKALWVRRGFGPIAVTGNTLESWGDYMEGVDFVGVKLRWKHPTIGAEVTLPARGCCVEVVNLALALDTGYGTSDTPELQWTDSTPASVTGGNTLFSENTITTEWLRTGGIASGVVVSSLASTVFSNNSCTMTTDNSYGTATFPLDETNKPIKSMRTDVLSGADKMAFALAHVYVGGGSSVQANGNRFAEKDVDALFSAWFSSALQPSNSSVAMLQNALVAIGNVGSHCMIGTLGFPDPVPNNVAIYQDEDNPGCGFSIAPKTTNDVRVEQAS